MGWGRQASLRAGVCKRMLHAEASGVSAPTGDVGGLSWSALRALLALCVLLLRSWCNVEKTRHLCARPKFRNIVLWSPVPRVWGLQTQGCLPVATGAARPCPRPRPLPRLLMAQTLRTWSSILTLPSRPGDHTVPGEAGRTLWRLAEQAALGKLGWHPEHMCTHTTCVSAPSPDSSPGICAGCTALCLPGAIPFSRPCAPQHGCQAGPWRPGNYLGGLGLRAQERHLSTQVHFWPLMETMERPLSKGDNPARWFSGENDLRESPLPLSLPQHRIK